MAVVYEPRHCIGGKNGGPFQLDKISQNRVVTEILVWVGGWQIRGIRLTFSDGDQKYCGKAEGKSCGQLRLDYAAGERITQLSIWGNGAGSRCGAFRIRTNRGQEYFPKMTEWVLKQAYHMPIGSGIILGAFGRHGADIDNLGFLMLRNAQRTSLTDVRYEQRQLAPPRLITLLDVTLANPSATDSSQGSHTVTKSRAAGGKWSVTQGLTLGEDFTVTAKVPEVAEVKRTMSWSYSASSNHENSWSNDQGVSTSIPLIAPKLAKTRITVSYYEGTIDDLPFAAQMRFHLDNGGVFMTSVKGVYQGVATSQFVQDTKLVQRWDERRKTWIRA